MICYYCGSEINGDVCTKCKKSQSRMQGGDGYFDIVKELNIGNSTDSVREKTVTVREKSGVNMDEIRRLDAENKEIRKCINNIQNTQQKEGQLFNKAVLISLVCTVISVLLFVICMVISVRTSNRINSIDIPQVVKDETAGLGKKIDSIEEEFEALKVETVNSEYDLAAEQSNSQRLEEIAGEIQDIRNELNELKEKVGSAKETGAKEIETENNEAKETDAEKPKVKEADDDETKAKEDGSGDTKNKEDKKSE